MRYFMDIAFDGTAYHGWQKQPKDVSVEETVERALSLLTREETEVVGAGRTDAGVHARQMVAHFDYNGTMDTQDLCYKLNALLPNDISVRRIWEVKDDAHARFDATQRTYEYWVTLKKDPFLVNRALWVKGTLDFERMNEAAATLMEYEDFTSFCKLHTDAKTNLCKVTRAEWTERGEGLWVFTISANRFLRNMVRAIVGTLLEVGRGKMDVAGFRQVVEGKNRALAGTSAEAGGLFLTVISY